MEIFICDNCYEEGPWCIKCEKEGCNQDLEENFYCIKGKYHLCKKHYRQYKKKKNNKKEKNKLALGA